MPFDNRVVTSALERRLSQASGPLWDEAWMRTGEKNDGCVHGCRRLRNRNNNPDEVNLKMNQETTSYRTIIAAKREPALLVVWKRRKVLNKDLAPPHAVKIAEC